MSKISIKIANLGRIVTGKTPPTNQPELYGTKYPFITPTDINEYSRFSVTERFISEKGKQKHSSLILPPDSICFTCIASIGKICMTNQYCLTNQQINSIIVDQNKYDPKYVYYLLRNEVDRIRSFASGVATPIINKNSFSQIPICVSPLPTQRKIAAILSAYDDLIENNTRRIQILEQMAQAIYREWFVEFRFPGHEHIPLVDSGTKLGLVPEGWEVKKLGEVTKSVRRNIKPDDINYLTPYFGLEHLPRRSIALSQWEMVCKIGSSKLAFMKGDILFGKIRPYFHKVGVAPLDGIGSSDLIVMRPINQVHFGLLLSTVSNDKFIEYATLTSQGTKMPRASWDVLADYAIIIPSADLLSRYNIIIEQVVEFIQNVIIKNKILQQTRDLLLPKLVSGEIDVREMEIGQIS